MPHYGEWKSRHSIPAKMEPPKIFISLLIDALFVVIIKYSGILHEALPLPSILIRPLGLRTQNFQLDVWITFKYSFHLIILVNSCNVWVFYLCTISNELDLFKVTCFMIIYIYGNIALYNSCSVQNLKRKHF